MQPAYWLGGILGPGSALADDLGDEGLALPRILSTRNVSARDVTPLFWASLSASTSVTPEPLGEFGSIVVRPLTNASGALEALLSKEEAALGRRPEKLALIGGKFFPKAQNETMYGELGTLGFAAARDQRAEAFECHGSRIELKKQTHKLALELVQYLGAVARKRDSSRPRIEPKSRDRHYSVFRPPLTDLDTHARMRHDSPKPRQPQDPEAAWARKARSAFVPFLCQVVAKTDDNRR